MSEVQAGQPIDREKDNLQKICKLEERISDLEMKVEALTELIYENFGILP